MVAEAGITDLKTFSIGFDDEEFNELPYAREVAAKWGCDHHERIVYPDAIEVIDKLVHHLDEPFADASAIPTWYVSKLAAEHVKVVLSGDGGDELFAGYDRFVTANDRLYLDRVPRLLRKFGASLSHVLPPAFPGKNFLNYAALDAAGRYATEHCPVSDPAAKPAAASRIRPTLEGQPTSAGIDRWSCSADTAPVTTCPIACSLTPTAIYQWTSSSKSTG